MSARAFGPHRLSARVISEQALIQRAPPSRCQQSRETRRAIAEANQPTVARDIRAFLDLCLYHANHVSAFSEYAGQHYALTRSGWEYGATFLWGPTQHSSLQPLIESCRRPLEQPAPAAQTESLVAALESALMRERPPSAGTRTVPSTVPRPAPSAPSYTPAGTIAIPSTRHGEMGHGGRWGGAPEAPPERSVEPTDVASAIVVPVGTAAGRSPPPRRSNPPPTGESAHNQASSGTNRMGPFDLYQ